MDEDRRFIDDPEGLYMAEVLKVPPLSPTAPDHSTGHGKARIILPPLCTAAGDAHTVEVRLGWVDCLD